MALTETEAQCPWPWLSGSKSGPRQHHDASATASPSWAADMCTCEGGSMVGAPL